MFTFRGAFTIVNLVLKGGDLNWCCGSRSQEEFTFIQIGSGHTVKASLEKGGVSMQTMSGRLGTITCRIVIKWLFPPPMPRFWGVLITYLMIICGFSIMVSIFRVILSRGMQNIYQMTLFPPPMPRFWGVLMTYLLIIYVFLIRGLQNSYHSIKGLNQIPMFLLHF